MKRFGTFHVVFVALFAALICVATMIIRIPIPATGGYANLGDGILLVCAFMMHPLYDTYGNKEENMRLDYVVQTQKDYFATNETKNVDVYCIRSITCLFIWDKYIY